jgi:xanthine dehydrogenase accessory factor
MPDDMVLQHADEQRTAFIALAHDPKLDDMALMEALNSRSFYVGAIGSKTNNEKRRERLATLDLDAQQIKRLHGPVGLSIGSKTPEEIAIAILAHVIAEKNRVSQRREAQ